MTPRPFGLIALAALVLTVGSSAAWADPLLEGRIARLERIIENQAGSDLLLQMQQMQMELQELRGLVEMQHFELQKLQRQQQDPFAAIDTRLDPDPDLLGPLVTDPLATTETGDRDVRDDRTLDLAPQQTRQIQVLPPTGGSSVPSLPLPEGTGGSERDAYAAAFELLKERSYDEASVAFNELLRRYPQGQFTDSARYWLGETHYVQRNYAAALAEFDRLVQLHPASQKVPGALLKIGYIQYDQQAFDQARAMLEEVIRRFPRSTEARLAKSRLDRMGQEPR
ncbi:MAG: tol-pal system protein YbgF [Sphingobacteriia bacterium]|nr:tol-pal system protein YbgF [Sphingobacteriia bacterium]NCC40638.1 tol-pal system protein YbgF [Gammaproteobacteria bacterium]